MAKATEVLDPVAAMQRSVIFGNLPKRQLKVIARYAERHVADRGVTLVSEGESGAQFCIILSGACEVSRGGNVLGTLTSGDCFGEIAVIDGQPRTSTIVTTEACDLLVLGQPDFEHAMKIAPGLARAMMDQLCAHVRSVDDRPAD